MEVVVKEASSDPKPVLDGFKRRGAMVAKGRGASLMKPNMIFFHFAFL